MLNYPNYSNLADILWEADKLKLVVETLRCMALRCLHWSAYILEKLAIKRINRIRTLKPGRQWAWARSGGRKASS